MFRFTLAAALTGSITDVFSTRDGDRQVVLATNLESTAVLQAQESLVPKLLCG